LLLNPKIPFLQRSVYCLAVMISFRLRKGIFIHQHENPFYVRVGLICMCYYAKMWIQVQLSRKVKKVMTSDPFDPFTCPWKKDPEIPR